MMIHRLQSHQVQDFQKQLNNWLTLHQTLHLTDISPKFLHCAKNFTSDRHFTKNFTSDRHFTKKLHCTKNFTSDRHFPKNLHFTKKFTSDRQFTLHPTYISPQTLHLTNTLKMFAAKKMTTMKPDLEYEHFKTVQFK